MQVSFTPPIKNTVLPLYHPNYLLPLSYFRGILTILAASQKGILSIIFITVLERITCYILPYSATCYIIAYYLVLFLTISSPTISSSTTSALAARATYLFIPALATPFPSP